MPKYPRKATSSDLPRSEGTDRTKLCLATSNRINISDEEYINNEITQTLLSKATQHYHSCFT